MRECNRPFKQKGRGSVTVLLIIGVTLVFSLCSLEALRFLYSFYDLKNQLRYELKTAALESDSEIRKKVLARIKRSGVSCAEQDIVLRRKDGMIKLEMPYRHEVALYILGRQRTISSYDVGVVIETPLR